MVSLRGIVPQEFHTYSYSLQVLYIFKMPRHGYQRDEDDKHLYELQDVVRSSWHFIPLIVDERIPSASRQLLSAIGQIFRIHAISFIIGSSYCKEPGPGDLAASRPAQLLMNIK